MTMIPIPSNDPLFQPFSKEFRNLCLDPQPLQLRLTKLQGWVILRQLQLALRHPKNKGSTASITRDIAKKIESIVAVTPALAEVAKRGWDPQPEIPGEKAAP